MLDYSDFYDIAVYGNENWKGSFTPKEIACNADCYYSDFKWSLERGKLAESISTLVANLKEDISYMNEYQDTEYDDVWRWITEIERPFQKGE